MKQRISTGQLQELTPEQQEKLREWWKPQAGEKYLYDYKWDTFVKYEVDGKIYGMEFPSVAEKKYCLPLLSIGQMLEIIRDSKFREYMTWETMSTYELCDDLWQAVKSIL